MKYKLTDETREWFGHILHRIEAVTDFGDVKAGDKGGWIEKEDNLSQDGDCWVYDDAHVYGNAWVCVDACVCGNARVYDDACVIAHASVYCNSRV